ncbi:MAG: hypothetical protein ACREOQ_23220 [Gemmatimonadales bacterium]
MSTQAWSGRLEAVLKGHRPGSDVARFRNDYKASIESASSSGRISNQTLELLVRGRAYVEEWVAGANGDTGHLWLQAKDLADAGVAELPSSLVRAFLSRLPRIPMQETMRIEALLGEDRQWLEFLIARGVVQKADVQRVVKESPERFYGSVGLDVIVSAGMSVPRSAWESFAQGLRRPTHLASPEELFALAATQERSSEAVTWIVRFLGANEGIRLGVLRALLQHTDLVVRLARELAFGSLGRKAPKASSSQPIDVATCLVQVCLESDSLRPPMLKSAASILGLLNLALITEPDGMMAKASDQQKDQLMSGAEHIATTTLRRLEEGDEHDASYTPVVLTASVLYHAVQKYLGDLPSATDDPLDAPERAARLARYHGQRDLLMPLVEALESMPEAGPLRDAVEVAVFNAGVRRFGTVGETVAADFRLHDPVATGLLPGTPAILVRPGYRWGQEAEAVLVKARIQPSD